MNETCRRIVDISADDNGWRRSSGGAVTRRYEKDGYEVYFFKSRDGFELTIRDPETTERKTILEVRDDDIDTTSPLYVALLEHILTNAENIVAQCSIKQ